MNPNAIAHNEGDASVLGLDVTRQLSPLEIEEGRRRLERLSYALDEYRQFGARRANTLDAEDKRLLLAYLTAVGEVERKAGAA